MGGVGENDTLIIKLSAFSIQRKRNGPWPSICRRILKAVNEAAEEELNRLSDPIHVGLSAVFIWALHLFKSSSSLERERNQKTDSNPWRSYHMRVIPSTVSTSS